MLYIIVDVALEGQIGDFSMQHFVMLFWQAFSNWVEDASMMLCYDLLICNDVLI